MSFIKLMERSEISLNKPKKLIFNFNISDSELSSINTLKLQSEFDGSDCSKQLSE